jgi:hypothetical protein
MLLTKFEFTRTLQVDGPTLGLHLKKLPESKKGFARRETTSGKMLRKKGGVFREHEFLETVAGRLRLS